MHSYDPVSTHFLLCVPIPSPLAAISPLPSSGISPKPIGTIRWTPSAAKLGRLAVMLDYRKSGLGRVLVESLHQHVAEHGADVTREKDGVTVVTVTCHSQVTSISHGCC